MITAGCGLCGGASVDLAFFFPLWILLIVMDHDLGVPLFFPGAHMQGTSLIQGLEFRSLKAKMSISGREGGG